METSLFSSELRALKSSSLHNANEQEKGVSERPREEGKRNCWENNALRSEFIMSQFM